MGSDIDQTGADGAVVVVVGHVQRFGLLGMDRNSEEVVEVEAVLFCSESKLVGVDVREIEGGVKSLSIESGKGGGGGEVGERRLVIGEA